MKTIVAAGLCCIAITSCSLYRVSKEATADSAAVPGIPILVKKPVRYQITKVAMIHWNVTFALQVGDKEIVAPPGGLGIVASKKAFDALDNIGKKLSVDPSINPENFITKVQQSIASENVEWGGCSGPPSGKICVEPVVPYGSTIENTVAIVSELSDTQYYINTRRPWIGTASATIKLAPDGTMTDATAEIEDKTAETLLSVLPVTDFFTNQWGLSEQSAAAMTADSKHDRIAFENLSSQGLPKSAISLRLEPITWIYVLRRRLEGGEEIGKALTYPEVACGSSDKSSDKYCVELVSAVSDAGKKTPDEKKPPAWMVSGSIVPPEKE